MNPTNKQIAECLQWHKEQFPQTALQNLMLMTCQKLGITWLELVIGIDFCDLVRGC